MSLCSVKSLWTKTQAELSDQALVSVFGLRERQSQLDGRRGRRLV